jgi:hypothetical protein
MRGGELQQQAAADLRVFKKLGGLLQDADFAASQGLFPGRPCEGCVSRLSEMQPNLRKGCFQADLAKVGFQGWSGCSRTFARVSDSRRLREW